MLPNAGMTLVYILFQIIPREQIIPEATAIIPWHFSAHRQEKFQPFATATFPLEYLMLLNFFIISSEFMKCSNITKPGVISSVQAGGFDIAVPLKH